MVADLARRFGDLDVAEEAAAEAFAAAAERWPREGVPPNPGGWLATTATRKAIDWLRRESQRDAKHQAARIVYDDTPSRADRPGRGRPAQTGLHLLPPRARDGGPGGAHPAPARRPHRRRDRPRLSGAGDHDGADGSPVPRRRSRRHTFPTGCPRPPTSASGSPACSRSSTSSSTRAIWPARGTTRYASTSPTRRSTSAACSGLSSPTTAR